MEWIAIVILLVYVILLHRYIRDTKNRLRRYLSIFEWNEEVAIMNSNFIGLYEEIKSIKEILQSKEEKTAPCINEASIKSGKDKPSKKRII